MTNDVTLEQVEQLAVRLPAIEQLKLAVKAVLTFVKYLPDYP